ncbi:glucuronate isomerase [Macrococcoides caseolyticum]|uniref:glucuronate isomerase n=1 Tax=Macrococcoides caseolyticum TaxID=69966 RepID=UPI001F2EA523|nr:glucuronate isomerase [Macrococcus caseolyticus]MCE4956629.1 glucuronate isomerase [Macrococcus caseolyticus]
MSFIHKDFMLQNETAKHLYHDYAKDMPIYDYHCHLDPKLIRDNHHFDNITELWLGGDHYKWRAMRAQGVEERYITGDASPLDKFIKWAETLENAIGNPLYHWSQLELKMYFGIDELLTPKNAEAIYHQANQYLKDNHVTTQSLIQQSNVKLICTTDGPLDHLEEHDAIKAQALSAAVLPAFRPDDAFNIQASSFKAFVESLEAITHPITTADAFIEALHKRIDYFHSKGSKLADHGIGELNYQTYTEEAIQSIFKKALNNESISHQEMGQFQSFLLFHLGKKYHELDWTMQIHFGAIRNNNTRQFKALGRDTGYDSINDQSNVAYHLNNILNMLATEDKLPKTILYNLNPIYNDIVTTTIANFQAPGVKSKVQHGAGWWFNDTKRGMLNQMASLSDQGMLMHFVGMLTDSRSFLSYSRHDYFRRILCTHIGQLVELGEVPNDDALLERMIKNICYNNAYNYFKLI